jgi:hypothetical protein
VSDEMNKYKWEELIGKRLLLTDIITRIQRNEWTLLELNSNGRIGKFRNELANTCFWTDLDDLVVMDVLPEMYKENNND